MKSKRNLSSWLKSGFIRLFSTAAVCFFAHGVWAANIYWKQLHGGDLQDDGNWRFKPGGTTWEDCAKPGSSDCIYINTNNDAPITLSEDMDATGGNSVFEASFELALTNSVGLPKTLSIKRLLAGGGNKTIRLTAGTLSFSDNFYMGDQSTGFHGDVFFVEGSGTVLSGFNTGIYVGSKNYSNTLCVTNGGTVEASTLDVGRSEWNENNVSTNNCFRVTGSGSTARFSNYVRFGSSGLGRIEVLDGGCLTTTNLYVRRNDSYNITCYGGNSVLVSGTGSKIIVNGASNKGFWLGKANAPDCSVTVRDGAVWESYGEFKIADGATTNAKFRVASGASVLHHVYSLNVGAGDNAVNATLEIDNATVASVSDRDINVKGEGSHISISGKDAKLSAGRNFYLYDNTRLNIEIPAGGFSGGAPPVIAGSKFIWTALSAVSVALAEEWNQSASGTYRIVLAEAGNDINNTGFAVNLPPDTDMVKVTRDLTNAKQIAVKVKVRSGLKITIR